MQNTEYILPNTTERSENEHCKYCNKVQTPNMDVVECQRSNSDEKEQNNYDIDHRITLFGWRLRLSSGKSTVLKYYYTYETIISKKV